MSDQASEMNWRIEVVSAGEWRRANNPFDEPEANLPRVHVIPVTPEAFRLAFADSQPLPNDHKSFTELNRSLVKVGGIWVPAYRPRYVDEERAMPSASLIVEALNKVLSELNDNFWTKIPKIGIRSTDVLVNSPT